MLSARVRPQLGGDELLYRIEKWLIAEGLPIFDSQSAATALRQRLKYTSNALARLRRRGLLTGTRVPRFDWRGMRHGWRYIYQISQKGHKRLRYLERRSWVPNLIYLGSMGREPSEMLTLSSLEFLHDLLQLRPVEARETMGKGPSRTDLGDFLTTIDLELAPAKLGFTLLDQVFDHFRDFEASVYWPTVLQERGLIQPEINVPLYCHRLSSQGLSAKEILLALLYRTNKRLSNENKILKEQLERTQDRVTDSVSELENKPALAEERLGREQAEQALLKEQIENCKLRIDLLTVRRNGLSHAVLISRCLVEVSARLDDVGDPYLAPLKWFVREMLRMIVIIDWLGSRSFVTP